MTGMRGDVSVLCLCICVYVRIVYETILLTASHYFCNHNADCGP